MIWKTKPSLDILNESSKNTLVEHLDIKFIEVGEDYLVASMPVTHKTVQPYRILHGGASVALAETLGSVASNVIVFGTGYVPVGLEINANHLRPVREGQVVYGKVSPIKIGRTIHVWQIEMKDDKEKPICISRLTVSIIKQKED